MDEPEKKISFKFSNINLIVPGVIRSACQQELTTRWSTAPTANNAQPLLILFALDATPSVQPSGRGRRIRRAFSYEAGLAVKRAPSRFLFFARCIRSFPGDPDNT